MKLIQDWRDGSVGKMFPVFLEDPSLVASTHQGQAAHNGLC